MADAAVNDKLMQALGFTPDDLAANRAGKLSAMQDYVLRVRRRRSIGVGVLVLLFNVFIASLLIFIGSRDGGSVILTLLGIGVTICSAALMGLFTRYWLRLSADIRGGTVQTATGPLERVIKPVSRSVVNYMIRVEAVEVFISKEAFEVFEHEQPYTLYRAPYTGMLLSAEQAR